MLVTRSVRESERHCGRTLLDCTIAGMLARDSMIIAEQDRNGLSRAKEEVPKQSFARMVFTMVLIHRQLFVWCDTPIRNDPV